MLHTLPDFTAKVLLAFKDILYFATGRDEVMNPNNSGGPFSFP